MFVETTLKYEGMYTKLLITTNYILQDADDEIDVWEVHTKVIRDSSSVKVDKIETMPLTLQDIFKRAYERHEEVIDTALVHLEPVSIKIEFKNPAAQPVWKVLVDKDG